MNYSVSKNIKQLCLTIFSTFLLINMASALEKGQYFGLNKDCGSPAQRVWEKGLVHNYSGTVKAFEKCSEACDLKDGCSGFSLNKTVSTCYLKGIKSGLCIVPDNAREGWNGGLNGWVFYKRIVKLTPQPLPLVVTPTKAEVNVETSPLTIESDTLTSYVGLNKDCGSPMQRVWEQGFAHNYIGTVKAFEKCSAACDLKDGCSGFSLNKTSSICYLKGIKSGQCLEPADAKVGWNGGLDGWIFYKRIVKAVKQPSTPVVVPSTDTFYQPVKQYICTFDNSGPEVNGYFNYGKSSVRHEGSSIELCKKYCDERDGCAGVTFDGNKFCYTLGEYGMNPSEFRANDNWQTCTVVDYDGKPINDPNYNNYRCGQDMWYDDESQTCKKNCASDTLYDKESDSCKPSVEVYLNYKKICPLKQKVEVQSQSVYPRGYLGRRLNEGTFNICKDMCETYAVYKEKGCNAFEVDEKIGACAFWTLLPGDCMLSSDDATVGYAPVDGPTTYIRAKVLKETSKQVSNCVDSLKELGDKVELRNNCWVSDNSNGTYSSCDSNLLKTFILKDARDLSCPHISKKYVCTSDQGGPELDGVYTTGKDPIRKDGNSVEDCKKVCDKNKDCAGFDYDGGRFCYTFGQYTFDESRFTQRNNWKACTVVGSDGKPINPPEIITPIEKPELVVSPSITTNKYFGLNTDCGSLSQRLWEKPYSHNSQGTLESFEKCAAECNKIDDCSGFSLNKIVGVCYLKSIKPGLCQHRSSFNDGWVENYNNWNFYNRKVIELPDTSQPIKESNGGIGDKCVVDYKLVECQDGLQCLYGDDPGDGPQNKCINKIIQPNNKCEIKPTTRKTPGTNYCIQQVCSRADDYSCFVKFNVGIFYNSESNKCENKQIRRGSFASCSFYINPSPFGSLEDCNSQCVNNSPVLPDTSQPPIINKCLVDNGGCSDTCEFNNNQLECKCPAGVTLSSDNKTCDSPVRKKYVCTSDQDGPKDDGFYQTGTSSRKEGGKNVEDCKVRCDSRDDCGGFSFDGGNNCYTMGNYGFDNSKFVPFANWKTCVVIDDNGDPVNPPVNSIPKIIIIQTN